MSFSDSEDSVPEAYDTDLMRNIQISEIELDMEKNLRALYEIIESVKADKTWNKKHEQMFKDLSKYWFHTNTYREDSKLFFKESIDFHEYELEEMKKEMKELRDKLRPMKPDARTRFLITKGLYHYNN